jgi:hypothetical protein
LSTTIPTDARPYLDLFSAAEVLQVGAATSAGLGSITVTMDWDESRGLLSARALERVSYT